MKKRSFALCFIIVLSFFSQIDSMSLAQQGLRNAYVAHRDRLLADEASLNKAIKIIELIDSAIDEQISPGDFIDLDTLRRKIIKILRMGINFPLILKNKSILLPKKLPNRTQFFHQQTDSFLASLGVNQNNASVEKLKDFIFSALYLSSISS